jgi:hypothetical protein
VNGAVQGSSGVNVYVIVPATDVLIVDGFQVPVKPFVDTVGKSIGVEFKQNGPIGLNVGTVRSLIVIVVVQVLTLQPSVMVHVIVDVPTANGPLASFPVPFLFVAPLMSYVIVTSPPQPLEATIGVSV